METILISGANRGIGLELTRQYLLAGHQVHAACRQPEDAHELRQLSESGHLSIHKLDVTSDDSVEQLRAALGEQTLDVLINNAGIMGGDHQSMDDMD